MRKCVVGEISLWPIVAAMKAFPTHIKLQKEVIWLVHNMNGLRGVIKILEYDRSSVQAAAVLGDS